MVAMTASAWALPPFQQCMHAERQRATRHCGSDVTAAITGLSALRLPQLLQSVPNHFPRLPIAPGRKNKACFVCIFCSVPFLRGKGIGAWGLEIGCCALGIGHWPWALGIGLWGEGCGDWSLGIALGIVGLPMADTKRRQSKRPTAKSLMSQSGDRRINRQFFFHTFDRHDSVVST